MEHMSSAHPELDRLLDIVARFRGEGGCAWFEAQTHASLVPYLLEEAHELTEAIEAGSAADRREELGDVLFQVLFHASIAAVSPAEPFTLEDVARDQADKLIRRNPHVFGDQPTREMDEIIRMWQHAKAAEKRDRTSVLDGVPRGLPSLALAAKLTQRAEAIGARLPACPAEQEASASRAPGEINEAAERALGRELLNIVAGARVRGLDAERALRGALRELMGDIRAAEQPGAAAGESAAGER